MEQKENAVQQNTDTTQDKSKTKSHNPVLKKSHLPPLNPVARILLRKQELSAKVFF